MNGTLNTTACEDCSIVYHQMNVVYSSMETQYTNTVCADTVKLVILYCVDAIWTSGRSYS